MKRNMRIALSAGSAVLLLLTGCGGASGSSDQSNPESKPAAPAGGAGGSAPANAAKPDALPALTQATSEGTLRLFIAGMQSADFDKVAELTDPGSEEYANVQKMAEAFNPATANPNIPKDQLDTIRGFFSKPWAGVEHAKVAEQGPRAQYTLQFFSIDPKTQEKVKSAAKNVELNQFEGKWRVLVNSALMMPGAPSGIAAPPGAAPAGEKPVPPPPVDAPKPQEQPAPAGQPPAGNQPKPQQ